jgi:hypothetical protein
MVTYHHAVALLAVPSIHAYAAPDMAYFSDFTINEAVAALKQTNGMVVVLANEQYTAEQWSQSAWGQPEFAEYAESIPWTFVYVDIDQEPAVRWLIDPAVLPTAIYFSNNDEVIRHHGLAGAPRVDWLLDWFRAIERGTTLVHEAREAVETNPSDIKARFQLISELHGAGMDAEAIAQYCWLIEHNDVWAEGSGASEQELRTQMYWVIGSFRDRYDLHWQKPYPRAPDTVPSRDGWQQAIYLVATEWPEETQSSLERRERIRPVVELRHALESRVHAGTATDRDLFALTALTGSGDQVRTLAEELLKNTPSP